MQFKHIAGQAAVKQRLINTVKDNRVSHAQLFLGPEGSGSLALAVAYAQYLSCEDRQPDDSCGVCASCHSGMLYGFGSGTAKLRGIAV